MFVLTVNNSSPAIGGLITAKFIKDVVHVSVNWGKENILKISPSVSLESNSSICRYLARCNNKFQLYGSSFLEEIEVDHWISFALGPISCNQEFVKSMEYLNESLASVTYVVGNQLTIADFILWGTLLCNQNWIKISDGNTYVNIKRWFSHINSLDEVQSVLKSLPEEVLLKTKKDVKVDSKDEGKFVELPDAKKGEVVVRFPPEASGYLHIGHAKAALLNQYYQEAFDGKLIMRFDDTNPEKEKVNFEKAILEDLKLLKIQPDSFTHTSDYFDLIIEMCEKLLKAGKAYADDTDPETMKQEREQRKQSINRNNSVEKNLEMWSEMLNGTAYGQKCCVRAKIDMENVNGCMRDPTIFRCKNEPHPRTGFKYKVYPTYDFACPIVDSIEGVTHALRTMEYHDRDEQFYWFINALGLRRPHIWEYSRLNMMNTVLSKRKLTWFVDEKIVDSWEDPRLPTVRGVIRRGLTVEGLKQFIVAQGSSRSVVQMEWDKIWAFNKKIIDPIAPRYNALRQNSTVVVNISNVKGDVLTVPKHPKNPDVGFKKVSVGSSVLIEENDASILQEGENATFINWGNIKINKINRDANNTITSIDAETNLGNIDFKKTLKLTWLLKTDSLVPIEVLYYDHLITKPVLGKDEDFKMFVNRNSKKSVRYVGEEDMKNVKVGDIIQLQRIGFFRCDACYQDKRSHISPKVYIQKKIRKVIIKSKRPGSKKMKWFLLRRSLVLIHIPDGSTKIQVPERADALEKKITPPLKNIKSSLGEKLTDEKAMPVSNQELEQIAVQWSKDRAASAQENISKKSLSVGKQKKSPEKEVTKKSNGKGKESGKAINSEAGEKGKKEGGKQSRTRLGLEATKEENLPEWYSQVITKGELIEYYDVSGCYILRPWSFALWEVIRDFLDAEIKALGVQNCYFPIFVSKSVLEKEKTHIADFAPEVAWVTKSGDSDLSEHIAIRPTSETVMYPAFAKWIQSYRDLPIKLNQWNNVVRWEFKHPQPFLRTREFLWQEGHTAFATYQEAEKEVYQVLDIYARAYSDLLAIPVIKGWKTKKEKFAGSDFTTTVEAYVAASGRGIQAATSHHLGQNFSKMFDITYEDPDTQEKKYVYQNSWGMTTRSIGVMIMVHADNKGLILPPRAAALQVVIVPCGITASLRENDKNNLTNACKDLEREIRSASMRVKFDDRPNYSPGWKFNHWELKGVPVRVELGPNDLEKKQFVAVRRDTGEKVTFELKNATTELKNLLKVIQESLLQKATKELQDHTVKSKDWGQFCEALDGKNVILSPFCGEELCEDNIKKDSARDYESDPGAPIMGAKSLCIPFDQTEKIEENDRCIHPACTNKPTHYTLFGRSY